MVRDACDEPGPSAYDTTGHLLRDTVLKQLSLGHEFLLRGYLVTDWYETLQRMKVSRPERALTHIFLGLWRIMFAPIWEHRNSIAHDDDNIVTKYERERLTQELSDWKREAATRLGHDQLYLTAFDPLQLASWTTSAMRNTIQLLTKAAKNYRRSIEEDQPLITSYFHTMENNAF